MVKQKPDPGFSNRSHRSPVLSSYQQGVEAFHRGDFDRAIQTWQQWAAGSPDKDPALAEAYFCRGLPNNRTAGKRQADLEAAQRLALQDARFAYHPGLIHHVPRNLQAYPRGIRAPQKPRDNLDTDLLRLEDWPEPALPEQEISARITLSLEDVRHAARAFTEIEKRDFREDYKPGKPQT